MILRELLVGSTRFNEIRRGVSTCSPAILSKRLKDLERAGIVERVVDNREITYSLTEAGRELLPIVLGLGEWGQRWVRTDYSPDELDPGLLLWDVRRNLQPGGLGDRRITIQFVFAALSAKGRYFWLVVDANEVDLCFTDPGREVDVIVEADLRTLTEIWMGDLGFETPLPIVASYFADPVGSLGVSRPRWSTSRFRQGATGSSIGQFTARTTSRAGTVR